MSGNQFAHLLDYSLHSENFEATVAAASSIVSAGVPMAAGSGAANELHWHLLVHSLNGPATLRIDVEDSADGVSFASIFASLVITPVALNSYYARMNKEALPDSARSFVQFRASVIGGTDLVLSSTMVRTGYKEAPQNGVHVFKNAVFGAALDGFGPYEKDSLGNEHILGDYPATIGL